MGRPRSPKCRLRPVGEVLEAYLLLFKSMYVGAELPNDAEAMLSTLGWVLGLPTSDGVFWASMEQVKEALRTANVASITNAREQQPQGEP